MLSIRSEERIRARRLDLRRGTVSAEDTRRRRAGETVRLRQEQRDEILTKRRRDVTPESGIGAESAEVVTQRVRFVSLSLVYPLAHIYAFIMHHTNAFACVCGNCDVAMLKCGPTSAR
jgi:hypothetical protein